MRKTILTAWPLVLVLALVSCKSQESSFKGSIEIFVGDVQVNNVPAQAGMTFSNKVAIQTGPDSYCDVVFGKNNIFRVFQNTEFYLDGANLEKRLTIKKGGVGFVLGNPIAKAESFTVETSVAVASVRGTVFDIVAENEDQVYVCTCNGTIDHKAGTDWQKTISASHHKAYRLQKNEDGTVSELPASLEYHNDEAMDLLASKVHLKIDWTKEDGVTIVE